MPEPERGLGSTVDRAAAAVRDRLGSAPRVAVVLGSGLGPLAARVTDARALPAKEIPGAPKSTVAGHEGLFVAGALGGVPVLVMKGRVHAYEGHRTEDVTFAVRLFAALGAGAVILSNAAGALTRSLGPGDLMLVRDHLDLAVGGARGERVAGGDRDVYSVRLAAAAREAAREQRIALAEGVLVRVLGPSYETRSEVSMYRSIGGHAVCMSTAPEATAAKRLGLEVLAISCITNPGTGLSARTLRHEDVTEAAGRAAARLSTLVIDVIGRAFGKPEREETGS